MFKKAIKHISVHSSHRLLLCTSKTNRFSVWNLMTCSLIFHFKVKKPIIQSHFLGDTHLILMTENSLLLFDFETSSFVEELKLWKDEKMARYIRDFNLTDLHIMVRNGTFYVAVGTETGKIVVWKIQISESGLVVSFQSFEVYKSRVKRVKWACSGDRVYVVTVSTSGDISVFDFTKELAEEFKSDAEQSRVKGAVAEMKIDVRITQLDVSVIQPEEAKNPKPKQKASAPRKMKQNSKQVQKKEQKPKKIPKTKQIVKKKKTNIKKGKKLRISVKSKN